MALPELRNTPRSPPPLVLPPWLVWPLALTAVCWVAAGDYLTSADVTFTLLYLGPIAFAAWFAGRTAGCVIGLFSASVWYAMDLLTRVPPVKIPVRLWNLGGQIGVFVLVALLVDGVRARLVREHRLARTDELTGLENRRAFRERLVAELDRAARERTPLTVACFDCDGFKEINDRYGHARGDLVLQRVAAALSALVRSSDVVGRLGGDEFGVLMPHTDSPRAQVLLAKIREALQSAAREPEFRGASVGAITFIGPPNEPESLLQQVDEVMYAAKRGEVSGVAHAVVRGTDRVSLSLTP